MVSFQLLFLAGGGEELGKGGSGPVPGDQAPQLAGGGVGGGGEEEIQ